MLSWQFVYLLISRDPARYRPVMILAILAKLSYALAVLALLAAGRVDVATTGGGCVDLLFVPLFAYAFVSVGKEQSL